jgi:hypothetical protein
MQAVLIALILWCYAPFTFAEGVYKTYHNAKYEYSISYPKNILYPQGEADNGDGQKFLSKDAGAHLLVYGSNNALDESLAERFREESRDGMADNPKKVVTYKRLKNNWFIVSGFIAGRIFYQKTLLNQGQFKSFYFEYPENQKARYEPLIKGLVASFQG